MIKIVPKKSGAYGHTCCCHLIQPDDFSKSLFHDIKNLKAMSSSSKHCVIGMGLDCKGSVLLHEISAFRGQDRGLSYGDKKREIEKLWWELFSNPSEWQDHRIDKINPRFPDFKHKTTEASLWLDSKFNPPWVEEKLSTIAEGTFTSSTFSWNQRLSRSVKAGQYEKTMNIFQQMQQAGINSDRFTFCPVLIACAKIGVLEDGRRIHAQILKDGFESDLYVSTTLVDMYVKCGSIEDGRRVFNNMPMRNVVTWNAMIMGYAKCGHGQQALELYQQMQLEGLDPDPSTFVAVLNGCASVAALEGGRKAHEQIIGRGYESDVFVGNSLIDMYVKCGSIGDAMSVFSKMPTRNMVTWTTMIQGYVKCGEGQQAFELSQQMKQEGVNPDPFAFVAVLNACASVVALEEGRQVHAQISRRGYDSDGFVGSSLIDMYAKCGSVEDAQRVFSQMPKRDVVSWNAMILGLVKCGEGQRALELSQQMQRDGINPDPATFVAILNACASVGAPKEGRQAHEQIIERGYDSDDFVISGLVDMYAKCGSIEDAEIVFNKNPTRNVVVWNSMMKGYLKHGKGRQALELSRQMRQEGIDLDPVSFMALLNACTSLRFLEEGRFIHAQIIQQGYDLMLHVATALIDMYAECGSIEDAREVFNKMPSRNVVAWNAMILGYVKCREGQQALDLSRDMKLDGVAPDHVTFVAILNACTSIASLEEGRCAHEQIIQRGFESNVFVGNSLIDMYVKCGSIENARSVFNKMPTRNMVSWNVMLAGYGRHGFVQESIEHFERMCNSVEVDAVTFTSILSACNHGGYVDEGLSYFESMSAVYNICPTVVHYACVVDLLGRAGQLHEAEDLIKNMPVEPDGTVWMSLLGASKAHGNMEVGERCAKQFLDLDSENAAGYVQLSNIYAATSK